MNSTLMYSESVILETLTYLQASGKKRCEGIVLWLGIREGDSIVVKSVYQPVHEAKADFFHIPPQSMLQLKEHLRKNRLLIASQVHSHPFEAFHSEADNRWAIVRHVGALSIVVPYFAEQITTSTFFQRSATFQLSSTNSWDKLSMEEVNKLCQISN